MATEILTNVTDAPSMGDGRPLLHMYRGVPRKDVRPGVVALCGHVHRGPRVFDHPVSVPPAGFQVCVVCLDLR